MTDWNIQKSEAERLNKNITDQAKKNTDDIVLTIAGNALVTIATTQQVKTEVNARLGRIATINENGFKNVTNAIEEIGAAICGRLDLMSSQLDIISNAIKHPLGSQIAELYEDGCLWLRREKMQQAINKFESALKIDNDSFSCNYKLGMIWLEKSKSKNVADIERANELLLHASDLAEGIIKTNPEFIPDYANCLMLASESFCNKVLHNDIQGDSNLKEAITYANNSISYNPKLPQTYYVLAKCYSLKNEQEKLLKNLKKALEMDRLCFTACVSEPAFDNNRELVNEVLERMTIEAESRADSALDKAKNYIKELGAFRVSGTIYESQISKLKNEFFTALSFQETDTYFGDLDAFEHALNVNRTADDLIKEVEYYKFQLIQLHQLSLINPIVSGVKGAFVAAIVAFVLYFIPACFVSMFWGKDVGNESIVIVCSVAGGIGFLVFMGEGNKKLKAFIESKKKYRN